MNEGDFITTIVREDLESGYKLVQTAHAVADFAANHYDEFIEWKTKSNYLCSLEASKFKIELIALELEKLKIKYIIFLEPDIGNEMTAIAIQSIPRELHRKLFKTFKLALSNEKICKHQTNN